MKVLELLGAHPVLFGLMVLNVVVFGAQGLVTEGAMVNFTCVPARVVADWDALVGGGAVTKSLAGLATLLTYAFLHADVEHLLFNLIYLWIFGYLIGELLGSAWVGVIYLLTALGGGICYVVFNGESVVPMLGASGAVLGFQGAYLGLAVRCRLPDPFVWPLARPIAPMTLAILAVIGFGLDLSGSVNPGTSNTAYATHLGGFVAGLFLTSFVTPVPQACR